MTKKTFTVSGMKCEHCQAAVENALNHLNGVNSATASFADGNVTIEFDENAVNPQEMKEAVDNSGRYDMEI